jgi:hypothetical protein
MEDMNITKRLIEAGRIMNIPVLDHIIVAGGTAKYFSFRDNAPNLFVADENVEYSVNKSFENEAREETELAFQIADRYISIHETDGGYDYSIMGADYREIDGGVYDNPEINIRQALEEIIEDLKEKPDYNGAKGSIKAEDVLIPRDYNEVAERMASANKIDSRVCIWQHQRRTGR